MDAELIFVCGLALMLLALVSFVRGFVESRVSRLAVAYALAGAGALGFAILADPAHFTLANVDDILLGVAGRYLN